jgi:hypothetical protein
MSMCIWGVSMRDGRRSHDRVVPWSPEITYHARHIDIRSHITLLTRAGLSKTTLRDAFGPVWRSGVQNGFASRHSRVRTQCGYNM